MHIDWWTLALQTANVLVLVWLLRRFLYQPVMAIIARRQAEAQKLLDDAAAGLRDAEAARAETEQARAGIAAERDKALAAAQAETAAEREQALARLNEETARMRAEARAALERERAAASDGLAERASLLAIDIARRLLERLPSAVVFEGFLAALCAKIHDLPPELRTALASSEPGEGEGGIEIVTASTLDPVAIAHCRDTVAGVLGDGQQISFRSDPSLIAGIELHGRHAVLRNSWKADLEAIRDDLRQDAERPA